MNTLTLTQRALLLANEIFNTALTRGNFHTARDACARVVALRMRADAHEQRARAIAAFKSRSRAKFSGARVALHEVSGY